MKITLRKVKEGPMGRESRPFTCDVFVDGKPCCIASNYGGGGPTDFWPKGEDGALLLAEVEEWLKTQPPIKTEFGDIPNSLAMQICLIMDEMATLKKFKRLCKTKTLFQMPGDPETEWRTLLAPYSAEVKEYVQKEHPGAIIYNELLPEKEKALA